MKVNIQRLTCPINNSAICPAPSEIWNGNSDGPTAEQHIVPDSSPDSRHSCVDTRELTLTKLRVAQQDPGNTLRS